jgi:DNA-binding transcriptional MocR family regulator
MAATARVPVRSFSAEPKYGQYHIPTVDDCVAFQIGQPSPSMLPLDVVRLSAEEKFAETDPLLLQYGYISGYPAFRKSLAGFLESRYEMPVSPDEVFATTGVTGGLSMACSLLFKEGDEVFAEEPTYFLAMRIFADFNIKVTQIPMEEDGLDLDALEARLKAGHIPKALYTIPTAHNPTGRTLSVAKRERLCQLSKEYDFLILADEVYQLLTFPSITPPPPMCAFDVGGTVLSMGSFSKLLAPALRLGWLHSKNPALLDTFFQCGMLDSSGGMNPVISSIVHQAIDTGRLDAHLTWVRETLATRADTLMKALDAELPEGTTYEIPDGGYFVLVRLPEHLAAADVLEEGANNHRVRFLPGSSFGDNMQNYLRLSFSMYDPDDILVGIQRLVAAIRAVEARQGL